MVTIGGLSTAEAAPTIDADVIVFILGVLLITGYLELGGFFEFAIALSSNVGSAMSITATRGTC
jgi:hypothetical protein